MQGRERFQQPMEATELDAEQRNVLFLEKAFSEYLQANIRFPQELFNRVSGFFILDALVSIYPNCTDEVSERLEKLIPTDYPLTLEQIKKTYTAVQAAHTKYDIQPAAYTSTDSTTEEEKQKKERQFTERLHGVWLSAVSIMYKSANSFRVGILDAFQNRTETGHQTPVPSSDKKEQWRFCWPHIITITHAMIEILNSEESKSLAKKYREAKKLNQYSTAIDIKHADYIQTELKKYLAEIYPDLNFSHLFASLNSWEYPK